MVEVLISDFRGDAAALEPVLDSRPDIFNHNLETVPRLYRRVRPGSEYRARWMSCARRTPDAGPDQERDHARPGGGAAEVDQVLRDLRAAGVDFLTLGQYLAPGALLPVARFVPPAEFLG